MGNQNTIDNGIKAFIKQEFDRVKSDNQRQHLKISEVLKLQHPDNSPFTFAHLGTLYVLDSKRTGFITIDQLFHFAQYCVRNLKNIQTYEFQSQLQGLCTSVLWDDICKYGIDHVNDWFIRLLTTNDTVIPYKNHLFIKLETVQILYELSNTKIMSNIDIQQFVDLLQQAGEEAGLMSIDQEELDELVPLEICSEFIKNFLNGFKALMLEIGFSNNGK
ncbi:unnamed protein product [Paramecium octaurelia]|uniref:Uncharacterized protein n=1 Tax=Paramecium octaurelia TaxID=43137 RepID=A0A8S1SN79_PAROT|nr:unnamed protein product [Paramecium octaurelia]